MTSRAFDPRRGMQSSGIQGVRALRIDHDIANIPEHGEAAPTNSCPERLGGGKEKGGGIGSE